MAQIPISTSHGLAHISKRGKHDWYYLKLSDTSLSDKDRKIRKPLKHVNKECYREYIIREVEDIYDGIINKRPQQLSNPVRFIQEIYFPYMDQMTKIGAPLPVKGTWNKTKTRNDKNIIGKYLISFIKENNLEWTDLIDDLTNEIFVDYMRIKGGVQDTSIIKYKGVFNIMFRQARKHKLITRLPTYPRLDTGDTRYLGLKERSIARATDQMMRTLLEVAENELGRSYRGKSPKTDWDRAVTYQWIQIVLDTGIRTYPNTQFVFDAIKEDGYGVKFYRKEKNRDEYTARSGPRAKSAFTELKQMYLKQGFTPIHVLSDIHGNKHKTIDRHTRNLIERAGWKELRDKGGRKYDPRSIRKWHINHAIELGEHRADIAERVGTSYAVICADYADNDFVPSTRPDSFDSVLNPIEKVLYLA